MCSSQRGKLPEMADTEYDALLGDLRVLTDAPNGAEFTRSNLIALLGVVVTHLGEALATKVGELENGSPVEAEHTVSAQLSGLVEALRDLDIGLTDPVFEPALGNQNARRNWRVRQEDKALIEGLEVFQQAKKIKHLKTAARKAASELRRSKYTRRGKKLSWLDLYNLYYRHKYNDL
jgi:hypothetical protein